MDIKETKKSTKENNTFIVKVLPINKKVSSTLYFDDVKSLNTLQYPTIVLEKYSDPIIVHIKVPDGYYVLEDHTKEDKNE